MTKIENIQAQRTDVFRYMKEHGEITQRDAFALGVYRLGARIWDLKHDGIAIDTKPRTVIKANGRKARIAVYSLRKEEDDETL